MPSVDLPNKNGELKSGGYGGFEVKSTSVNGGVNVGIGTNGYDERQVDANAWLATPNNKFKGVVGGEYSNSYKSVSGNLMFTPDSTQTLSVGGKYAKSADQGENYGVKATYSKQFNDNLSAQVSAGWDKANGANAGGKLVYSNKNKNLDAFIGGSVDNKNNQFNGQVQAGLTWRF